MDDRTEAEIRNAALEEAARLLDDKWAVWLVDRAAHEIRQLKYAPAAPTDQQCKEAAAIASSFGGGVIDVEAAAKKLAECMDYPWAEMREQGRKLMREHAQAVVSAALAATKGESNG